MTDDAFRAYQGVPLPDAPAPRTGVIARDKRGRIARFDPTDEQRALVGNLAGIGCTQEEIVQCIPWGRPDGKPINAETLRAHFRAELDRGRAAALSRLKQRAFDMAEAGDRTMLIFLLKTQCGWKETIAVEATGKDGAPLPAPVNAVACYLPLKDARPEAVPAQQLGQERG